jgi:hypothetical protein
MHEEHSTAAVQDYLDELSGLKNDSFGANYTTSVGSGHLAVAIIVCHALAL